MSVTVGGRTAMDRRVFAFVKARAGEHARLRSWTLSSYENEPQALDLDIYCTPSHGLEIVGALWRNAKRMSAGLESGTIHISVTLMINNVDVFGPIAEPAPEPDKEV